MALHHTNNHYPWAIVGLFLPIGIHYVPRPTIIGGELLSIWQRGPCMAIVDVTWRSKGACQGLDAEIFYPENDEHADFALAVCQQCEVRTACLHYALDAREQQGVWGGATASDRRKLLRQRKHSA